MVAVSAPAKPSLQLLRSLSDRHVVAELLTEPLLTRAEIAVRTGLSKPTVSESMKRLEALGVVVDSGQQSTGRGRAGAYYTLREDFAAGLVVSIGADGVAAELVDIRDRSLAREQAAIAGGGPDRIASLLEDSVRRVLAERDVPVRAASVAVAAPVDRQRGRVVPVDHSPVDFGDLQPVRVLGGVLDCPIRLDNDVNWIAGAERDRGAGRGVDNFLYLYLGEGLGAAVVVDGRVHRGWRGLAGEIAGARTLDGSGHSTTLIGLVEALGLTRPGSSAIDVAALHERVGRDGPDAERVLDELVAGLAGVITSASALLDSELVLLGGPWSGLPGLLEGVGRRTGTDQLPAQVRLAEVAGDAVRVGLRGQVQRDLTEALVPSPPD